MVRRYTLSTNAEAIVGTYLDFKKEFTGDVDVVLPVHDPIDYAYYVSIFSSSNDFDAKTLGPFNGFDDLKLMIGLLTNLKLIDP
jgi:hypothetical protein